MMAFSGRIYLGCDGFGEKLKEPIARHLRGRGGLEVEDLGTGKYYEVAAAVARAVQVGCRFTGLGSKAVHRFGEFCYCSCSWICLRHSCNLATIF